jgi:energy-coupling factor transporter transmembrane protein EcfT
MNGRLYRFYTDTWSSARGPVVALAPVVRLATGAAVFAACLTSDPRTVFGSGLLLLTVGAWLTFCRVPQRVLWPVLAFGVIVLAPFFALSAWIAQDEASGITLHTLAIPWGIFLKGVAVMLVTTSTFASMSLAEFASGLACLPLPRFIVLLLAQMAHQAGMLLGESSRIRAALTVRGAGLRALASVPRVWLVRVMTRAERVSEAMQLRGYGEGAGFSGERIMNARDWISLATAAGWLTLVVLVRVKVLP